MRRNRIKTICNGAVFQGTREEIVLKLEACGRQAEREKDSKAMHAFFQHAEHYKKREFEGRG